MTTAILAIDVETPGHGKNLDRNRMIALAGIVVEPHLLAKYKKDKEKLTREEILEIVPESQRFSMYIHDSQALKEIENVGPIWQEIKGREFWLAEKNTLMLHHALNEMSISQSDETQSMTLFETWLQSMMRQFPKLLFISDTSNFDFAWLDHYRKKFLQLDSINHATQNGFVLPIDTGSFYFGLTRSKDKKFDFNSWDNLNSERVLKDAGFHIPEFEIGKEHEPLNDALKIGLRLGFVISQI